jgi:pilus assembly protein CpaE
MRVVLSQEQPRSTDPVRHTLLGLGLECAAGDCVLFGDLPARLSQGPADLVLVRVGPESTAALKAIREATGLTPAPVLALGPATDAQHILETARSGARVYLDEGRLQEDLEAALDKLRLAGAVWPSQGLVVTVASPTPGSGVTTVATNLAFTWADKHAGRVALVEMGRDAADLALCLDLAPQHTVAEVIGNWQRMDAALLQQSMEAHAGGVKVLAYKPGTLAAEPIDPAAARKTIVLMRTLFAASVFDLGHSLADEHFEALRLSDAVVLVLRLDVPAVRQMRQFLRRLEEHGLPRERLRLVANRYGQRGQIDWRKAEEVLGLPIVEYLPEDSGRANAALNQGQPLVRVARFKRITRRFAKLADYLNGKVPR